MTISYPLSFPASPAPRSMVWRGNTIVGITESIYTFAQEVLENVGNRWEVDIEMPPMTRTEHDVWKGWLMSLYGRRGTFLLHDPAATTPKGIATGTPLVDGANAANAKTLATKGWTISQTGILLAGDKIQLGSGSTARLHMVLADVNSDGAGDATLDIWPRLRTSYVGDEAITTSSPAGVFRLADQITSWSVDESQLYGQTFSAVEAI